MRQGASETDAIAKVITQQTIKAIEAFTATIPQLVASLSPSRPTEK